LTLALLLLGGCADHADESGYVTIGLPQISCPDDLALSKHDTCAFAVDILAGEWRNGPAESLFSEPCVPYSGDLVTITGIRAGEGFTVHLKGFADSSCTEQVLIGARGGVRVLEGVEQDGIWYVPTFGLRKFSEFPTFARGLRELAGGTQCSSDDDCLKVGADGFTFEVSPSASCDKDAGTCRLPSTTYPLNMGVGRAFHTATALADGRIALVGGVTHNPKPGTFLATDEIVSLFDPVTMTWSRPELDWPSGLRVALHAATSIGGNRLAFFGGARQVDLSLLDSGEAGSTKKYLEFSIPDEDLTKKDNIVSVAVTVDFDSGTVQSDALSAPRVGADAIQVKGGSVLVSGGLEPVTTGTGVLPSAFADLCDGASCSALGSLNGPRFGHCSLCLDDDPGANGCETVLLFGGLSSDLTDGPETVLGEVFKGSDFTSVGLIPGDLDGNVVFPTCVRAAKNNYLVGGTERLSRAPSILPALLSLTSSNVKVGAQDLDASGGVPSVFRVHAAATALEGGRVLVSGGLDDNGKAVGASYIIEGKEIIENKNMRRPRFGHTATLITTGPLKGAVLIAGGLTTDDEGALSVVTGAELYVP